MEIYLFDLFEIKELAEKLQNLAKSILRSKSLRESNLSKIGKSTSCDELCI